jgi:hypothetical protein
MMLRGVIRMPNIFDGLAKVSDAQLLDQVTLLESVNMANISKPYVTKAKKGVVNAINGIGKLFGKDFDIKEPENKELVNYIDEKRKELRSCSRFELEKKMINNLRSKSKLEMKNNSFDVISVKVIEEACTVFKISENLTSAQKADNIYEKFTQRLLENMQKMFKKQNREEIKKTQDAIVSSLQVLTQKQRDEIKSALSIERLSGEAIRRAFLKTGAPALILEEISKLGFGAFVALNTIINAALTTVIDITIYASVSSVLSITSSPIGFIIMFGVLSYQITNGSNKLDRELLAQIVWLSVNANRSKFTPADEELPSWVCLQKTLEVEKDEEKYKSLIKDKELAIRLSKENNEKLEKISQNQIKQELLLEQERLNLAQIMENLDEQSEEQKQIIKSISEEIEDYIVKNKNLKDEKTKIEIQNGELQSRADICTEKVEKIEEVRRKFIIERWPIYFRDFKVDICAIRDVVRFNREEILAVERALTELYNVKDPVALSQGKIKDNSEEYENMAFLSPDGILTRILYKLSNSKSSKVEIVKVYKDNGDNEDIEETF